MDIQEAVTLQCGNCGRLNELENLLTAVKAVRRFNTEHTWGKSGILLHNPQLEVISLISAEVKF